MVNDQDHLRYVWAQLIESCAQIFSASTIEEGPETAKLISQLPSVALKFSSKEFKIPLEQSLVDVKHNDFKYALTHLTDFLPWEAKLDDEDQQIKYAWVDLIGPDSMQHNDHFRMGLFWQNSHVTYPRHYHNAVELYYVLSGIADWQQGGASWFSRPEGSHFLHQSREVHATRTHETPLLTLWAWHGDLSWDSYQFDN